MPDVDSNGGKVVRDTAWVQREYGREKWPTILAKMQECLASGERSLSRVVSTLVRWEWDHPDLAPITVVALKERVRLPASMAWYGCYALVAEAVIAACRPDTDAIIDLGCGWGRSLFEIWLRGGPRAAVYRGMELTQAGLDCVVALAELEPHMRVRTACFDFRSPDFSSLERHLNHAVVFTLSSLHQVPEVDPNAYRALFGIAQHITCLHFEPFGWQIASGAAADADRAYALRNDYNRNLWDVLSALRDESQIKLTALSPDLVGMQARYPLSLVQWERSQA